MLMLMPAWVDHQHHQSYQHHRHHHQDEEEGTRVLERGRRWDGSVFEVLVHRVVEGVLLRGEAQLLTCLPDPESVADGDVSHLEDMKSKSLTSSGKSSSGKRKFCCIKLLR